MAYESIHRLLSPVNIRFNEAIMVAVIGLAVNLISAYILNENHHHQHGHEDDGDCGYYHQDHNLRAAYLHVLADALTSILAIAALTVGKFWGWAFMDPIMGIIGAIVITRWSYGLLGQTGKILLDYSNDSNLAEKVREAIEKNEDAVIEDLHIWKIGPGHHSAIVSLRTGTEKEPSYFKNQLCSIPALSHVTVEVNSQQIKS
jgi:cation diffusion facilitator family transporter